MTTTWGSQLPHRILCARESLQLFYAIHSNEISNPYTFNGTVRLCKWRLERLFKSFHGSDLWPKLQSVPIGWL